MPPSRRIGRALTTPAVRKRRSGRKPAGRGRARQNAGDNSVCVFLGAGASAAGGYRTFLTFPHMFWPTSDQPAILHATDKERALLSAIRTELDRKKRPLTLDQYLWILNDYNTVLREIFSDEELRCRFSDSLLFMSRIQELNEVVQRARTNICKLTVGHYSRPPKREFFFAARDFFEALVGEFRDVAIYTTNYDIVPEYLFSDNESLRRRRTAFWRDHGRPTGSDARSPSGRRYPGLDAADFDNGFPGFSGANLAHPSKPPRWSGHAPASGPGRRIAVFRLHGCVAWFYTTQLHNAPIEFHVQGLQSINNYYERLCIMYPGKESLVGRDPHARSFSSLYDRCLAARYIIAVGFAFRDIDVVTVMFSAFRQAARNGLPRKRLIIVDPYLDEQAFLFRLREAQERIAAPVAAAAEPSHFDVVSVRSNYPPDDPAIVLRHCR